MRINISKKLLLSAVVFLLVRSFLITSLPIFNDEAIYIDWGWRSINLPGETFHSLYDGKQPLLMWIFGIEQIFLPFPLTISRMTSVFFGLLTFLGLFKLGKLISNERVGYWSAFLYLLSPLHMFFDRQALMESALCAVGVWSFILFTYMMRKKTGHWGLWWGTVIGTGLFIKSSAAIFIVAQLLLLTFVLIKKRTDTSYLKRIFTNLVLGLGMTLLLLSPLLAQKEFWQTLNSTNRYALTIGELLAFPIMNWLKNAWMLLEVSWWQISPIVLVFSMIGLFSFFKKEKIEFRLLAGYQVIIGLLFIFLTKSDTVRYMVSITPMLGLFAANWLEGNTVLKKIKGEHLLVFSLVMTGLMSFFQIVSPRNYLLALSKVTQYSQAHEYLVSWTSGLATTQAINYLKNETETSPAIVMIRVDTGNPESAILTTFSSSKKVSIKYFDEKMYTNLNDFDCLQSRLPIYFVSRDFELGNTNKYWEESDRFYNHQQKTSVGIYRPKENCEGKVLNI